MADNLPNKDGWHEWSKYVLKAIEEGKDRDVGMLELLTQARMDIAQLKIKAGIWGLIGGAIPVAVGLAVWFVQTAIK